MLRKGKRSRSHFKTRNSRCDCQLLLFDAAPHESLAIVAERSRARIASIIFSLSRNRLLECAMIGVPDSR